MSGSTHSCRQQRSPRQPPAPLGSCPLASPLTADQCRGRHSTCWSVGVPDLDCPDWGLCCFDGCANTCAGEAPPPPPAPLPAAPDRQSLDRLREPAGVSSVTGSPLVRPRDFRLWTTRRRRSRVTTRAVRLRTMRGGMTRVVGGRLGRPAVDLVVHDASTASISAPIPAKQA